MLLEQGVHHGAEGLADEAVLRGTVLLYEEGDVGVEVEERLDLVDQTLKGGVDVLSTLVVADTLSIKIERDVPALYAHQQ